MQPTIKSAFKLLMQGEEALTQVSINGFKVNIPYLEEQQRLLYKKCDELKHAFLTTTSLGKEWYNKYGEKADLDSSTQIREVLIKTGFDKFKTTAKGGLSVDKTVIEKLPYEVANLLLKRNQLKILHQSLIKGILREVDENGFIHPNFNIHTVRTYRGSCDAPNLQQMPKNNEEQKYIVRSGFLPRTDKRQLMEIDLRSAEVTVGCCLHQDPVMLDFLHNPDSDMHKTVAMKFYGLTDDLMTKKLRSSVKGRFVFASFYGASFKSIGDSLWEYISEQNPTLNDGKTKLADHMQSLGVVNHDTCINHAEAIFDWYWHDLFKVYGAWKEEIWELYKKQGYLDLPTGFRVVDKMTKTQAMNVSVQGSTFHVLLNTLIKLQNFMLKYKLQSKIVGEIHDSIVLDVVPEEISTIVDLYLESQALVRKEWSWLIHPIAADADIGLIGGDWAHMEEFGTLKHSA